MYDLPTCTNVVLTLGYIFAMASPQGGNGENMRTHERRGSGMSATRAVQKLPNLYWNTSNPM